MQLLQPFSKEPIISTVTDDLMLLADFKPGQVELA